MGMFARRLPDQAGGLLVSGRSVCREGAIRNASRGPMAFEGEIMWGRRRLVEMMWNATGANQREGLIPVSLAAVDCSRLSQCLQ